MPHRTTRRLRVIGSARLLGPGKAKAIYGERLEPLYSAPTLGGFRFDGELPASESGVTSAAITDLLIYALNVALVAISATTVPSGFLSGFVLRMDSNIGVLVQTVAKGCTSVSYAIGSVLQLVGGPNAMGALQLSDSVLGVFAALVPLGVWEPALDATDGVSNGIAHSAGWWSGPGALRS